MINLPFCGFCDLIIRFQRFISDCIRMCMLCGCGLDVLYHHIYHDKYKWRFSFPSLLCPLFRLQLVLMLHINIRSSLCFFYLCCGNFCYFHNDLNVTIFFCLTLFSLQIQGERHQKPNQISANDRLVQINYYLCVDIWIITNFLLHWSKTFNNIALYSKFFPAFSILNSNWNTKILAARCHQCKPCGVYSTARKISCISMCISSTGCCLLQSVWKKFVCFCCASWFC